MKAYKYVDLKDAASVCNGGLLIGTLWGMAKLDSERRDDREATVRTDLKRLLVASGDSSEHTKAIARSVGIGLQGHNDLSIRNTTRISQHVNVYCFCMSSESCNLHLLRKKPQAIFEVSSVETLADLINKRHGNLFARFKVGEVSYAPSHRNAISAPLPPPDVFVKDVAFEKEKEIRIAWRPNHDEPIEPFITGADPAIASLLTRIA